MAWNDLSESSRPYLSGCVRLVNGLSIEPEADLPHRESLHKTLQ